MSDRRFSLEVLILKTYPIGDTHRGLFALSREQGTLSLIAFGAQSPRSRFRALLTPLRRVKVSVYHDPVKDSYKIEEAELLDSHEGLAHDPQRFFSAARWADLVRRVPSLEPGAYELLSESLRLACGVSQERLVRLEAQFLWRLAEESGLKPEFLNCDSCGAALFGSSVNFSTNPVAVFCPRCSSGHWTLSPKEVDYLTATAVLSLEDSLQAPTEGSSLEHLRSMAFDLWSQVLGQELPQYG